jgi:hypothetical protein
MAHNSSTAVKVRDIYIDMQYVKIEEPKEGVSKRPECTNGNCGNCNKCDYIEKPWRHCENLVKTFLSMRSSERENFKTQLGEIDVAENTTQLENIRKEEKRIKRARARFASANAASRIKLLKDLEDTWREWENEVKTEWASYKDKEVEDAKLMSEEEFESWQGHDWEEKRRQDLELKKKEGIETPIFNPGAEEPI